MGTRPHPGLERPLHGPLQSFDLQAEATRLREEKEWQEGRRNAITLQKHLGLSSVRRGSTPFGRSSQRFGVPPDCGDRK